MVQGQCRNIWSRTEHNPEPGVKSRWAQLNPAELQPVHRLVLKTSEMSVATAIFEYFTQPYWSKK